MKSSIVVRTIHRGPLPALIVAVSVSVEATAQAAILNPNNTKFPLYVSFETANSVHAYGPTGSDLLFPFPAPA